MGMVHQRAGQDRQDSNRYRGGAGWRVCPDFVLAGVLILIGVLSACAPEQQPNLGSTGSAQVNLKLTFPQQSALVKPVSARRSQLLALLESWLPTATAAWARENVSNLSTLRVTVTGEGLQTSLTDEKQLSNPDSGDVVTFDLEVPEGANRVFAVDGFKNQLIIFTGRSAPITLTAGRPASVDITLVDNTGTITGIISNGQNAGATATMTVQGTTLSAPISNTGAFTIDGIPQGDHSLVVSAPGFISRNLPVVVPAGDTISVGTIALDQIPPATGIITGTVNNADTQALIPGATVTVDGLSFSTLTNSRGSFTLAGVPVGSRTLTVTASGFSPAITSSIQVTAGSSSSAGAVTLTPLPTTGSGTGIVENATTGERISGATVTVNGLSLTATTNSNGGFTLAGVPAGVHTLTVSAPGFFPSTATRVQVTAGSRSSIGVIALTPIPTTGSVTGTVTNAATQAPFPNATVTVNGLSTTTGSNGRFTLTGVPAGQQTVTVSAQGFSAETRTVSVPAGDGISIGTIQLTSIPTTGSITGTVVANNEPIRDITVSVVGSTISDRTRDNGSFTLDGIPQGSQTVLVSVTGFNDATKTVTVVAGQSVSAGAIALTPVPTDGFINGKVTNANTQVSLQEANVSVDGLSLSTTTNSDGNFTLTGVPAGQRTVAVSKSGFTAETVTVTVEAGQPVDAGTIALRPVPTTGSIEGKVTNANTQASLQGANVSVDGLSLSTTTNSDGNFTLTEVPPGPQTLTVSRAEFTSATQTVTVVVGQSVPAGTIALKPIPPTGSIVGKVTDARSGNPLEGASVKVINLELSTTTNSDGNFTLTGVPVGLQALVISAPGFFTSTTPSIQVTKGLSTSVGTRALTNEPVIIRNR